MDIALLILDYLTVLLSIPVAVVVIILIFHTNIRQLMARVAHIRLPGGSEFSVSQLRISEEEPTIADTPPDLSNAEDLELPGGLSLPREQEDQLAQLIRSERSHAALWEYRYLNLFLARTTQVVLDQLAESGQTTSLKGLDAWLQPFVPEANERDAILAALHTHRLIEVNEDAVRVTPKGQEYVKRRGPLPTRDGYA